MTAWLQGLYSQETLTKNPFERPIACVGRSKGMGGLVCWMG